MPWARAARGPWASMGSTVPAQFARVGANHAVDDLHQRRLAGAVLAEHGVNLAGQHRERYAVVGGDARIALRDVDQLEPEHGLFV